MKIGLFARALTVAAVVVGGAVAAGPAHAASAGHWVAAGPPDDPGAIIYADQGTNHDIRIWRERHGGSTYSVWAEARRGFVGHFHFWGPGVNVNSVNQRWYALEDTRRYYGSGGGNVCVEGWEESYLGAGDWRSIGLPCLPT
jgi:hypothetical protein